MTSSNGELIIVVDDSKPIRMVVQRALESDGYHVAEFENMTTFVSAVKQMAPHLIILDLILPDASGLDYLELRKADPHVRDIPVIVLSALTDQKSVFNAVSLGAIDYCTKPMDPDVLKAKVWKALKDRRFLSKKFLPTEQPPIQVESQCRLVKADQSGFIIETPAKIAMGAKLHIESPFLTKIGWDSCVFTKKAAVAQTTKQGIQTSQIQALGLSEANIKRMKESLGETK